LVLDAVFIEIEALLDRDASRGEEQKEGRK
jgi:hypothetical protein